MIKITKDNLFLWSRLLPFFFGLVHLFFIAFVIAFNVFLIYIFYAFMFIAHFIIAKVWRYTQLKDVYLTLDNNIIVVDGSENKTGLDRKFIREVKTSHGITTIYISDGKDQSKLYCLLSSKENLKFILPQN